MRVLAFVGRPLVAAAVAALVAASAPSVLAQSDDDPAKGSFTLADATKGVPGPAKGTLTATIDTTQGKFTCEFFEKEAPNTVANFVGLARGLRPWKDPKTGTWVKKPFYDGLTFHRVIPDFMIQGGDPLGSGMGNPGYRFADEVSPGVTFDKPGLLAMANSGPNTNGSQFFITVADTSWLTGKHTIFGEVVEGYDIVEKISKVSRDGMDRPKTPVVLQSVTIERIA